MTHNGIPVNWRPSNLVPKPRALPASCPLSADTLSGLPPAHPHIMQVECHWGALDMTLAHWIMDAHMPVKFTLNRVCTSMLVSGVCFLGNSQRLTSPLRLPHRAMGEGGRQTSQLSIHIVQVKHFDDPAYHIPWRDQRLTQDSFFFCPALFPQEVSSLIWHPFPHEFHLVSDVCFQGSSHSETHLEILGLYRPPPPPISHPSAALDFIQQLTIPASSPSIYFANEFCVCGWRRQPGNLLSSSSPLSYLPQSSHPHHLSCNCSCNSSIYFAFVSSIQFSARAPFPFCGELTLSSNLQYVRRIGENNSHSWLQREILSPYSTAWSTLQTFGSERGHCHYLLYQHPFRRKGQSFVSLDERMWEPHGKPAPNRVETSVAEKVDFKYCLIEV